MAKIQIELGQKRLTVHKSPLLTRKWIFTFPKLCIRISGSSLREGLGSVSRAQLQARYMYLYRLICGYRVRVLMSFRRLCLLKAICFIFGFFAGKILKTGRAGTFWPLSTGHFWFFLGHGDLIGNLLA